MADISENSCEIFMPSERSVAAPTSSAEFSDDHTPPPIEFSHNHSQLSLKRPNFVKASSSSTSPLSCKEADVSNDVNNLEQYPHNVPFLCNTTTAAAFVQPFLFNNPFLSTPFATYLPQNDVQSDFAGSNGGLNTDLPANSYSPSAAAATATEFYHRLLREYASRTTLTQSDASSLSMATTLQKQSLRNTDDVLPETLNVGLINNYSKPTVSSQSEQAKLPENAKSHSSSIILLTHTQSDSEPEKQTELSSSASSTFNGVRQSRNSVSPSLPDHCIPWENENILTVEPHSPAHLPNQVAVDEQNVIKSTDASLVDQPDFCKDLPERKDKLLINHNNNNVQSSSGRENKTTAMIHKQISEIEKELMRKTQNENIKKMDPTELAEFLAEHNTYHNQSSSNNAQYERSPSNYDEGAVNGTSCDQISTPHFTPHVYDLNGVTQLFHLLHLQVT